MRLEELEERITLPDPFALSTPDRPIDWRAQDELDRGPLIDHLVRALVVDERDTIGRLVGRRATGAVLGLTGPWGAGKSSVLNLLEIRLSGMANVAVAKFNPWVFSTRDELFNGFFDTLRVALRSSPGHQGRNLRTGLGRYRDALRAGFGFAGHAADASGVGGAGSLIARGLIAIADRITATPAKSPASEKAAFEASLRGWETAVVVLIDELDRIEDSEVRSVAQLVKAIGDIRGISYLAAYDAERVIEALGHGSGPERKKAGAAYLEKIIQYTVPLRPLLAEEVQRLLRGVLDRRARRLPPEEDDQGSNLLQMLIPQIETPRDLKRLTGTYVFFDEVTKGEVDPTDLLAYSWLTTKSPIVRDAIAEFSEDLVDDPITETSLINQIAGAKPDIASIFPTATKEDLRIIKYLFPRADTDSDRSGDAYGTRISLRRNLVRLLYLGNPPGMISRSEVMDLYSYSDEQQLLRELRAMSAGRLADMVSRLDDFWRELPAKSDLSFWGALSQALARDHDWADQVSPYGTISKNAAAVLYRGALLGERPRARAKNIIQRLRDKGDLILVPDILRDHIWGHGLAQGQPPREGAYFFSKEETKELLESELPRYRKAVLDETILRRLPSLEAVFVLLNTGRWTKQLRASLTRHLDSVEALATFASMIVPPGTSIDYEALDELVDAKMVMRGLAEVKDTDAAEQVDPSMFQAMMRLETILSTRDPFFEPEH